MITAWQLTSKKAEAEQLFARLRPHVPWVHVLQTPSVFNAALATKESQPWLDPEHLRPCQQMSAMKHTIIKEFELYEQAVAKGTAPDLFTAKHADAMLATHKEWKSLCLMQAGGDWVDQACSLFPETCSALHALPEVSNALSERHIHSESVDQKQNKNCGMHANNDFQQWCPGNPSTAGMVAFYSLPPNRSITLHSGPSNQRLKCQLVVSAGATSSTGAGSRLSVGTVTRTVTKGLVYSFDDSYLHDVHNTGTTTRVILDVTFWHPDLTLEPDVHSAITDNRGSAVPMHIESAVGLAQIPLPQSHNRNSEL